VLPITASFSSEAPLHPKATELLSMVFEKGWADPTKIHTPSRETALLLQEAREVFATAFGVRSDEIYFLGEPPLAFHLGINGFLTSDSSLFYYGTDRAPVHAIADTRENQGLSIRKDAPNIFSSMSSTGAVNDVLVYQTINPETGVQKPKPEKFAGRVFVDNTAYGVHSHLPHNWTAAFWQSRSWQGPSGLGVLAIRTNSQWRNPLPHNDSSKVPQSFSIPLALASAVAFENFTKEYEKSHQQIAHYKKILVDFLHSEIGNVIVAGEKEPSSSFLISASIAGVDSEKLINELTERRVFIDAGSACLSGNMQPSHVLAAMGLPTEGNIRLTLHPQTREEEIDLLLTNLKDLVLRQRS
jgi:cysteine desulfurase